MSEDRPRKGITSWDPPAAHAVEESDAHYLGVHVPHVRQEFVDSPHRLAYYILRALRQYDYNGNFNHRLTAYRWITTFTLPGPGPQPTEAAKREAANCLRNVRRFGLTEDVLLDRRSGQPSQVKYLFEYRRYLTMSAQDARERAAKIADEIASRAESAIGARLVIANLVDSEAETIDDVEPRTIPTGRLLDETDQVMFMEVAFDSDHWGDLFFAQPGIAELIFDYEFAVCRGYHVEVTTAYDGR